MSEGYIALHRRIREHPYWSDPDNLRAWLDVLFMAAWKERTIIVGGTRVTLQRGEFLASERYLSERWGWSRGKVRRYLEAAHTADEIRPTNSTSNGTTYRVVKYDTYQDDRPTNSTSNGPATVPATVPATDQREEGKEVNNNNSTSLGDTSPAKKRTPRTTALPTGWSPSETHVAKAAELRLDAEREAESFRLYHGAKGSRFADWDLAFHTWLRNAPKFQRSPTTSAAKPAPPERKGVNSYWTRPGEVA